MQCFVLYVVFLRCTKQNTKCLLRKQNGMFFFGVWSCTASNSLLATSTKQIQTTNTTSAKTHGFGESLEPLYIFSAKKISTSELLRFLQRMAASKPTFWLSFFFYILYHLVISLGP